MLFPPVSAAPWAGWKESQLSFFLTITDWIIFCFIVLYMLEASIAF